MKFAMCKYERLVRFSDAFSDDITYFWLDWNGTEQKYIDVIEFVSLVEFRILVKHSINTLLDGSTKTSFVRPTVKPN